MNRTSHRIRVRARRRSELSGPRPVRSQLIQEAEQPESPQNLFNPLSPNHRVDMPYFDEDKFRKKLIHFRSLVPYLHHLRTIPEIASEDEWVPAGYIRRSAYVVAFIENPMRACLTSSRLTNS